MKQQVSALIIALILAFTLASCSTSSEPSASSQEKQNSTTEPVELSEEAAKMVASIFGAQVETDLTKGTLMPYSGYYYGVVEMPQEPPVNGRMATRIYKQYIPEGLHRSMDYEVLLTVPDGWNTEQFLISSGWKDLADEKIFSLFILEPGESGWGSEDEESYYIEQSFIHRLDATTAGSLYVAAYGTGGSYLQKYMLTQPMNVASAAFINASDIDKSYYEEVGTTALSAGNAAGSIGATTSEDNAKVTYGEIPVPVWIIDDDLTSVQAAVNYWMEVNQTESEGTSAEVQIADTTIYPQSQEIFYRDTQEQDGKTYEFAHSATPDGLVANVLTTQMDAPVDDPAFTRSLYEDFLCKTFRYGSTIWSNILIEMPDYEAMGVDMLSLDYTVDDDTISREFLVYQPDGFQGDLPVVYIFPGGNQSHVNLFNATGWYRIAEENGIIVVAINGPAPYTTETGQCSSYAWGSGTDYTADEAFMEKVMAYVNENYPTDESRVYTSGLWDFTRYFALNHPGIIAAQGSVSAWGSNNYKSEELSQSDLATFTMVGENDMGNPVIGQTPDMVLDCLEKKGYTLGQLVLVEDIISDENPRYYVNEYYLADDSGSPTGDPIIRWGWVFDRGHSFLRTDYEIIWDTWFSRWSLNTETGEHIYQN